MSPDGWTALAVLGAAIVAFASDRVRPDAVGLAVLLALSVTGLITPAEAIAGFSDSAVLMIAGLFVVGEALVTTGVAAALGARLARLGRGSEVRLIVLMMLLVATTGAFMSSTGVVAIFIPVVLGLVGDTGFARASLMMPLAFAALVSGLMTLIATAPNLVVSAALADRGFAPFGFFELTPIGLTLLVVAVVYMVSAGRWLLARPEPAAASGRVSIDALLAAYDLTGRVRALRVCRPSSLIGLTIGEAVVRTRYGVTVVSIVRPRGAGVRVLPALIDTVIEADDRLAVTGPEEMLARFAAIETLEEEPIDERLRAQARQELGVAEVMLAPDAPLIGKTVREAEFRRRHGLTVLAVRHRGRLLDGNLSQARLDLGDVMLVAGPWQRIAELAPGGGEEFVVLRLPDELKSVPAKRSRAGVALAILAAMTLAMSTGQLPNVIAVLAAALAVVAFGCVPGKDAYRSIGWSTLVLIAGMLPLATALDKTGVTTQMASGLTRLLADVGPTGMLAVLFALTAAVGLFVSNTATAVLIAPIAIEAADSLGVSAHAFAVTVAVAASCAFATPVSSPVNTLVLEPGGYRFNDFVKVGLPLLLLALIVTVAMVSLLYPLTPPSAG